MDQLTSFSSVTCVEGGRQKTWLEGASKAMLDCAAKRDGYGAVRQRATDFAVRSVRSRRGGARAAQIRHKSQDSGAAISDFASLVNAPGRRPGTRRPEEVFVAGWDICRL